MKLTSEELKEYEEGVRLKLLEEIEKFVGEDIEYNDDCHHTELYIKGVNRERARLREFISKMK